MPDAVYLRDLPPARRLRVSAVTLATIAGLVSLASGSFAMTTGATGQVDVARSGALAYAVVFAAGFFAAAYGLAKARAWSWMLLAGIALTQVTIHLPNISSLLMRLDSRSVWVVLLMAVPVLYHGAVLALALHPGTRRACAPPPAAW